MLRSVGTALIGTAVLAALAGCATQDSFGLPDLTPRGGSPGAQVYPGYGYGAGYPGVYQPSYGYGYGVGYPNIYPPGYGNVYRYASPYYAVQGPYPYGYGYAYNPHPRYIVVPCTDGNRDGRCGDAHPPKRQHDRDQHGHDNEGDDRPARPRPGYHGEIPRVRDRDGRNVVSTTQPRAAPGSATVRQPPEQVRHEPRRVTPLEATTPRGPRVGSGRRSATGSEVVSSRPTQEP